MTLRRGLLFSITVVIGIGSLFYELKKEDKPLAPPTPSEQPLHLTTQTQQVGASKKTVSENSQEDANSDLLNKLMHDALLNLSKKADLKKLTPEEAHHGKRLSQHDMLLGDIAQLIYEHPELEKQSISFYEKCSYNQDFPDSTRALCLTHLRPLSQKYNHTIQYDQLTKRIYRLSEFLM